MIGSQGRGRSPLHQVGTHGICSPTTTDFSTHHCVYKTYYHGYEYRASFAVAPNSRIPGSGRVLHNTNCNGYRLLSLLFSTRLIRHCLVVIDRQSKPVSKVMESIYKKVLSNTFHITALTRQGQSVPSPLTRQSY